MPSSRLPATRDWTEKVLFWRSPRRHLYAIAASILFSVWVVELEAFNLAASDAACPWPQRNSVASGTGSSKRKRAAIPSPDQRTEDNDVHLLILADPQILWTHAYPNISSWLKPLPPWLADHYVRKAYRSLLRRWSSNGKERVDAVVWLGDLTDEGRRHQDDEEWTRYHDHFDKLFPKPKPRWSSQKSAVRQDGLLVLRPRPRELPFVAAVGNHDVPIPRQVGENEDVESDHRAKPRFTERYGTQIFAAGSNRWRAFDPAAATSIRANLQRSFNALVSVSAAPPTSNATTHQIVMLNAMELIAIERDSLRNVPRPRPPFGGQVEAQAKRMYPDTYEFVNSLRTGRSNSSGTTPARVILSHVPLWRPIPVAADEPNRCSIPARSRKHGVYREHKGGGLVQDVDRYDTYQNMLSYAVSDWVRTSAAWTGGALFSGDDHDHCEFVHELKPPLSQTVVQDFGPADLPELTVKSMSMTMGVRKPGFARVTLFAPQSSQAVTQPALAYTPCLLPDRIGLSIAIYTPLVIFGLLTLAAVHTGVLSSCAPKTHSKKDSGRYQLLPMSDGSPSRRIQFEGDTLPKRGLKQALKELGLLVAFFAVVFYLFVALL